jgi:hypothetical protein
MEIAHNTHITDPLQLNILLWILYTHKVKFCELLVLKPVKFKATAILLF